MASNSDNHKEEFSKTLELKYIVSEREIQEAKLAAEEAKRAWREEHDARIEAEEAKSAVITAAEQAMQEAKEMKEKLAKELEEAKIKIQNAMQAKKIYEDARAQTEEVKSIWREACRARVAGKPDDKLIIEANEAEERIEYILKWIK